MAIKNICQVVLITLCFASTLASAYGINEGGESIQINTRLHKLYGNPTWLLILRDEESQRVFPYQFHFSQRNNFWLIFSHARSYRITASKLSFGPYAEIKNFCHLENRSMSGQSLNVTLSGELSPVAATSRCSVQQYKNYNFTVVDKAELSASEPSEDSSPLSGLLNPDAAQKKQEATKSGSGTVESTISAITSAVESAPTFLSGAL